MQLSAIPKLTFNHLGPIVKFGMVLDPTYARA